MAGRIRRVLSISVAVATAITAHSVIYGSIPALNEAAMRGATLTFNKFSSTTQVEFEKAAFALGRGQFRFQNLSVRHEGAEADLIASVGDVNVTYTESYIPWIINPKKRLTEPIVVEKLSVSNVSTVLFDAIEHQEKRRRTGSAKVLPNVQLKDITLTVRAIKICIVASSSYQSVQTLQNINIDLWDRATGELVLSSASNDVQKLPQIHIDSFNCFKPISLQNIAFDAFLRANASGRVGSRGKFSISEGRSCTERQLVAADIPIEAAFARFLFFPLNLVSQASLDFEMTSSPVRKHDDGSHDYMYGAKLVLRDFKIQSGEVSTEDQRLKRSGLNLATVEILRRYMKTQENTQIPVEFDIVMNEKDHQPEKFVSAIASAFVTRAINSGVNALNGILGSLHKRPANTEETQAE